MEKGRENLDDVLGKFCFSLDSVEQILKRLEFLLINCLMKHNNKKIKTDENYWQLILWEK